ncbi:uncharacterized protein LOC142332871 [Lycorma delicatula]|uniref:uncharacterized protein LOC142332871 n=1 Tax=Lycorma delicatula TaxID=130591 RepID=UPI003F5196DE
MVQEEDCLVISISKTCTLLMYKWKKENGLFELLFEQNRINGVRKIKAINHQNETLLITKSASNVNLYNCGSDTDNILWKYSEGDTQLQFVQKLTNLGELLDDNDNEYYNGTFYSVNGNCICKWSTSGNNINYKAGLCREDNLGATSSQKLIANVNNNNQNFKLLINSTDNDTRITEYSLHPSRNYLAIAEIDYPKLQSTTDSIKIYKLDGKLQNKILTLKPHALNWLDIPGQYWISFIENRTTLQVYQQKDENIEFLNILSYCMASENLITITLPYQSKLNQIPLMILHGANIVRIIKGNMAGDPYNGISPDCNI